MHVKSILFAAVAGVFLASSPMPAAEVQDSEQVSKMLSDAKTMAFQLREDAVEMETFTRQTVSWQSHSAAINLIREHANTLGKQAQKLKDAKSAASPWQKTAIDRMQPYLDELSGYITASIEHINDKKHTLAEYNYYLEANVDYATDLANMIANFVDYGKARQRIERLGAKLEIPSPR